MTSAVSCGLVVLLGAAAGGRPVGPAYERQFRAADGLPQSTVQALAQTPDGYLWVGTDAGLARFDGRRFVSFTAEDTPELRLDRIRALHVDRAGDLWIGTYGGAGLVRLRGGRFQSLEAEVGGGGPFVGAFQDRAGDHWFGTMGALVRLRAGRYERIEQLGGIAVNGARAFAEDGAGRLWIGMLSGLVRIEAGVATALSRADGEALTPVTALAAHPDGTVWVGTEYGGVLRARAGEVRALPLPAVRPHGAVRALAVDHAGEVWAATAGGLARVREDRVQLVCPHCVAGQPALAVLEDREQNLWVGTHAGGLVRIGSGVFDTISGEALSTARALAVIEARDGSVWIGTDGGGLVRSRGGGLVQYRQATGLCTDHVWALAEDAAGGLWVGGEHGGRRPVCRLDPATGAVRSFGPDEGLPQGAVRALTIPPDGPVLVGTIRGLYEIADGRAARVPLPGRDRAVYAIHRDRAGILWVAGNGGLLHRRDGEWRAIRGADGLSNGLVFSIDEDAEGTLWLGTLRGFSAVRNGRAFGWRTEQGYRNEPVFKVLPDDRGRLWLCSPRGVVTVPRPRLDGAAAAPLRQVVHGTSDGLAADQCEGGEGQGAGFRGGAGRLHFPVGRTVAVVDPSRPERAAAPPSLVVEAISVDGRRVPLDALDRVPPGRRDLQIDYTAPVLARPERLRFRYRLTPFDPSWVDAGDRRVAYYTHLPPGRFTFEVMADAQTSEVVRASLPIVLLPRLHERAWFRVVSAGAALLAVAGAVLLWHRRRLAARDAQHRLILAERSRIARDLHDTLAQGFTGIAMQLEAASGWMDDNPAHARDNLDKARSLVRASLVDARRAVWDLGPEALERGGLVSALGEIARSLGPGVPVRVQVNGRPRPLPPPFEQALVRVGQEALTNACKHAEARNVVLEISFLEAAVQVRITDDGRGFDPARGEPAGAELGGRGLAGIRARAEAIGGALVVRSGPGLGTEIEMTIPYPADVAEAGE